MDVVKQNIASLNGSIEVESEEGRGTRFRIRLPLTLAILDGQLISIGTETFVLPLVSIVESVKVQASHFSRVPGHSDLYRIREEDIPVLDLHKEFGLVRPPAAQRYDLLIVVEGVAGKVALVVDDILAQQQVVIKSFENNYRHVDGIAGATILGSGRVALILDVASLVRLACRRSLAREGAAA